jgi:hypothetical protein
MRQAPAFSKSRSTVVVSKATYVEGLHFEIFPDIAPGIFVSEAGLLYAAKWRCSVECAPMFIPQFNRFGYAQ